MTDWSKLAEPFPPDEIKQRPGAATWEHKPNCEGPRCRETRDASKHIQFSYVDARAVAQRLDDVLTPAGWQWTCSSLPGDVVHGRLSIVTDGEWSTREDHGYPNSDRDEEPLKAATSDALKRCAVLFGIGRHLYDENEHPSAGSSPARSGNGRAATPPPARPPARSSTNVPDEPEFPDDFGPAPTPIRKAVAEYAVGDKPASHVQRAASNGGGWTFGQLAKEAEARGIPKNAIYVRADDLFGKGTKVTDLTPEQREQIAFEMGFTS